MGLQRRGKLVLQLGPTPRRLPAPLTPRPPFVAHLSLFELFVLGEPRGVTLAGDEAQQTRRRGASTASWPMRAARG